LKPKGRPKKSRLIEKEPEIKKFSPRGRPGRPDEISVKMEEFEAIRLIDCLGKKQTEAAKEMCVSQQTLSRIIRKARKNLSDAFINGKIIKIQGGKYKVILPATGGTNGARNNNFTRCSAGEGVGQRKLQ
jgi:predicted DNA-binding protein (UPF0251 family)